MPPKAYQKIAIIGRLWCFKEPIYSTAGDRENPFYNIGPETSLPASQPDTFQEHKRMAMNFNLPTRGQHQAGFVKNIWATKSAKFRGAEKGFLR